MHTDPLTGSRYPDSTDSPNVAQYIQNAVLDLSDNTIPRFTTTAARDSAYAAYLTATGGGSIKNGSVCWCDSPGAFFDRIGGSWIQRLTTASFAVGTGSYNSNSSGFITIGHTLGVVPSAAFVQSQQNGALDTTVFAVTGVTSSAITARVYYNGAVEASATGIPAYWLVFP